jgi:hypothetical protein
VTTRFTEWPAGRGPEIIFKCGWVRCDWIEVAENDAWSVGGNTPTRARLTFLWGNGLQPLDNFDVVPGPHLQAGSVDSVTIDLGGADTVSFAVNYDHPKRKAGVWAIAFPYEDGRSSAGTLTSGFYGDGWDGPYLRGGNISGRAPSSHIFADPNQYSDVSVDSSYGRQNVPGAETWNPSANPQPTYAINGQFGIPVYDFGFGYSDFQRLSGPWSNREAGGWQAGVYPQEPSEYFKEHPTDYMVPRVAVSCDTNVPWFEPYTELRSMKLFGTLYVSKQPANSYPTIITTERPISINQEAGQNNAHFLGRKKGSP